MSETGNMDENNVAVDDSEAAIAETSLQLFFDRYSNVIFDEPEPVLYDVSNLDFSKLGDRSDASELKSVTLHAKDILDLDGGRHIFMITNETESAQKITLSDEWTKVASHESISEFSATYNGEDITLFIDDTVI